MISYLQIDNASKNFGDIELFKNISFNINKGDKVAIVAKNGSGKTTLLNILAGKNYFDEGKLTVSREIKIGYLEQDPQFEGNLTVFQTIYNAPGEIMETVRKYELALTGHDQKKLEEATALMDFHHAWNLEAKIKKTLNILELKEENQRVSNLSGGQIKRLALATVIINEPQFLILDEPTNHLDLNMIEWLEDYLIKSDITLLMVTHDRYFLDRICNEIIEIDEKSIFTYIGNYSLFIQKREDRLLNKALSTEKAQNLLRKELEWMRKMPKARTTKAKYRIDAFYDLKKQSEYRRNDRQIEINVKTSHMGKKILILNNLAKRFNDLVILDNFNYTFTRGERLGIIGKNGIGKTTFLNIITGELFPDSGKLEYGETVVFGYYKQQGLVFKPGQRVIDVIRDIAEVITLGDGSQLSISQFLTRFLFPPELQYVQVEKLSGGEKRRLFLMTILIKNPNFLILDEPTNDFDIVTLNVLEEYLLNFKGCLIMVSHDRFFMDKIVDHLFIFEGNGEIYDFPGNYSDFRISQKQQDFELNENQSQQKKDKNINSDKKSDSLNKKLTYKEKLEYEQLTTQIDILEKEKNNIISDMNSGILQNDKLLIKSNRIAEILKVINEKTDRWLELSEKSNL